MTILEILAWAILTLRAATAPAATPHPTHAPTPPPRVERAGALTGLATWYDDGPGLYAAAGPAVRRALGEWRNDRVKVCSAGSCLVLRLRDWCACGKRHGTPTLLDLSPAAFRQLGYPLSRGVITITVR